MNLQAFLQYCHVIKAAYRQYGITGETIHLTLPDFEMIAGRNPEWIVQTCLPSLKRRLALLPLRLDGQFIDRWFVRTIDFNGVSIAIPIINVQGADWYSQAPIENFDFLIERRLGLLDDCRVIYDFGGHHGVWAAYYASITGGGLVYSFEPSILNIEISCLLHLVNGISSVVNIAAAIGTITDHENSNSASSGMLVDFVDGQTRVIDLRSVSWQRADFLKMDIEGFEYDVITAYPWIFDLAENFHIELHIPHLNDRKLDYREVLNLIPFDKFSVVNTADMNVVEVDGHSELIGFCSLMLKRRKFNEVY